MHSKQGILILLSALILGTESDGLFSRRQSVRNRDPSQSLPLSEIQTVSLGLQPGTCPCVRPVGGGSCVAYNDRYQAATLDEVVMNFLDTTVPEPSRARNLFGQRNYVEGLHGPVPPSSIKCKSRECQGCYDALTERLSQMLPQADFLSLGLTPSVLHNANCSRLQKGLPRKSPLKPPNQSGQPNQPGHQGVAVNAGTHGASGGSGTSSNSASGSAQASSGQSSQSSSSSSAQAQSSVQQNQLFNAQSIPDDAASLVFGELAKHSTQSPDSSGSTQSSSATTSSSSNGTISWHNSSTTIWPNSTISTSAPRPKRDAPPGSTSGTLGTVTPLDCSYKKGDPIDDGSGYVGLCSLCWSLRTLSPKYFPRYVNEVSCDSSDSSCLSGYAKCRERYRSIDVLYNTGTDAAPKWQQYSINSPISCECQVLSGSAMHEIFTRGKSSS